MALSAKDDSSVEVIRIGPDSTISTTTTSKSPKSWENLDVLNVDEIRGVQNSQPIQNPQIQQSKSTQTAYQADERFKKMLSNCVDNRNKQACQQALAFADKNSTQCNLNSTEVCRLYAQIFLIHNQRQKALNARQIACNGSNATACFEAWQLYKIGKGIKKNPKQGFALLTRSCDFKNAQACYELAEYYRTGVGAELNLRKAKELYSKSCDLGNSEACDAYNEFL
ncbi:sel1 repeat family protein [Helicobacter aurati]|uniref:Beta-lactamase n=2 Tax=Helicobacter aurati TaxID=137778 RepID=A0A3D8J539_9HELI|nr:sel1 repeat family protein [Helicobacter aurati]